MMWDGFKEKWYSSLLMPTLSGLMHILLHLRQHSATVEKLCITHGHPLTTPSVEETAAVPPTEPDVVPEDIPVPGEQPQLVDGHNELRRSTGARRCPDRFF